jgi:uncharacterized protein YraI
MHKRFVIISLALSFVFVFASVLQAAPRIQPTTFPAMGTVNAKANVRSGPGTDNGIVASASAGTSVVILACNDDCSWYQIAADRWIAAFLVDLDSATTAPAVQPNAATTTSSASATANANANIRSGPGTTYDVVGRATSGQTLTVTGRNEAGDWYQLADGTWIAAFLVDGALGALPIVGVAATENVAPVAAPTQVPAAPTAAPVQPTPRPPTPVPDAPSCDSNYEGTCIPVVSYDLNCPDVGVKDFYSVGSDSHGFDRDNDGLACES